MRLERVTDEMGNLESVDKAAAELLDKLKRLQKDMIDANPWGVDEEATRRSLEGLRGLLESHFGKGRQLNDATREVINSPVSHLKSVPHCCNLPQLLNTQKNGCSRRMWARTIFEHKIHSLFKLCTKYNFIPICISIFNF